jgi:hypothetical protein
MGPADVAQQRGVELAERTALTGTLLPQQQGSERPGYCHLDPARSAPKPAWENR